MANNAITVDVSIVLKQNSTINDIARQLQKQCRNKLICTINDETIVHFGRKSEFPRFLVYKRKESSTYLFETEDGKIYRVFGIDAAKLIYPSIDQEEPSRLSNSDPSGLNKLVNGSDNVYQSVYGNKSKSVHYPDNEEKKSP